MSEVERAGHASFGASYYKDVGVAHDAIREIPGVRLDVGIAHPKAKRTGSGWRRWTESVLSDLWKAAEGR
jgi:hypothetical protein